MSKQYGYIYEIKDFPKPSIILSLMSIKTMGKENKELTTPDEVMEMAEERGCTHIAFHLWGFPQRPVALGHPKLMMHLKKLFKDTK